ncbi:MAG: M28 family metallopeptidase [Treponema sp.]|nr:M28 family metallopeptidase [Treponema sp.]MCL2251132.1 M28 family metallopeptidase [Treponema sp.]
MKNNISDWSKNPPYDLYFDFIAENADRYAILLKCIETQKLNSTVIPVEGNRHIFIFPQGQKNLRETNGIFPFSGGNPFLLCAHYDRVQGSPGANDNSIAVFQLINAAMIFGQKRIGNWMIVFTDKEEITAGESLEAQGSYSLAEKLRLWGLEKARIFNFDVCGAGNVFVFSTITEDILKHSELASISKVRNSFLQLRDHALVTANKLRMDNIMLAPTPFSDDVGFLRAGLAAQTITLLPEEEAKKYEALLRTRPDFADLIISGKIKEQNEYRNLPETWRSLNNASDVPSRLTPQFFELTVKFAVGLVDNK